jgi:endo-1,4-beta-xylanase
MQVSLISALLLAPILSHALPHDPIQVIREIDWEKELLGKSDDGLEKRARPEKSIDAIFKGLGKQYFGTATDQGRLGTQGNVDVIQADFGQVTPENR